MNKDISFKKISALLMSFVLVLGNCVVSYAEELSSKTVEAAYGTPVIDGVIDDLWSGTNYTFIDRHTPDGSYDYTGWMKTLWDENNIYVLAEVHTFNLSDASSQPWNQDCIEVFIDENCGRTSTLEEDDYQIRANFNAVKTSKNYPETDFQAATKTFNMGYVVELAIPMKNVKLSKDLKMGFDAQVYRTSNFAFNAARIGWSAYRSDISSNTSDWGTIVLKDKVMVTRASVPEFSTPVYDNYSVVTIPCNENNELISGVSTMFNYQNEQFVSVLHVNEYPCMEINTLAGIIGADVENGNVLVKDGIRLTYTEGERLMQDNKGNVIMMVEATNYNNQLYIPLSSLQTTLMYDIRYNRFTKELDIVPFNEPKEAEFVAYAKDYGAVGDGVHDDKDAILAAFHAAINSGKPARVELEANKTYYVSETMDNVFMFWINGVRDFVFDGNGSTILMSPSQVHGFSVTKSERVRIEDLNVDSKIPIATQGTIRGKSKTEGTILLEFDEGYPVLRSGAWAKAHGQESCYIIPIQQGTTHSKYVAEDYAEIADLTHIEGRLYKAKMTSQGMTMIDYVEAGDRFAANYTVLNFDLSKWKKANNSDGFFSIITSGDVELRNINTTAAKWLGCTASNTFGNIRLNNFSAVNDKGNILSNGRDFIHTTNVRGTMIWENSTIIGCGDDVMNTKTTHVLFKASLGDRKYRMQNNGTFLQGDELLVYDPVNKKVLGRAFAEEVEYVTSDLNAEAAEIKLDRDIPGIVPDSTIVFNISTSNAGQVVRNNVIKNGKRWAWVNRSPNCIFENNIVENMNGSMVAAENELSSREGPFPSAFTIRNNSYYCDGNGTPVHDPLQIQVSKSVFGDTAAINGVLVEGNVFESSRVGTMFRISDVNELYMFNNKIINHGENTSDKLPVTIRNSVISKIDGLTIEYDKGVEYAVNVAGCEYNEGDITNIVITNNNMKPFKDWWK